MYGEYYRKNNYDMRIEEISLYQYYFYLEEGILCFKDDISDSGWDDTVIVRISIDDIEDYLKVPKWQVLVICLIFYHQKYSNELEKIDIFLSSLSN